MITLSKKVIVKNVYVFYFMGGFSLKCSWTKYAMVLTALLLLVSSFFSPFMQSFASAADSTKITIHYQPAPNDTKEWGLWIFPEGGEGKPYTFTGEDQFRKVAEVELPGTYDKVGFIVRTESWEKDGGDRFVSVENGEGEVWVKSGDEHTYMSPPDGEY